MIYTPYITFYLIFANLKSDIWGIFHFAKRYACFKKICLNSFQKQSPKIAFSELGFTRVERRSLLPLHGPGPGPTIPALMSHFCTPRPWSHNPKAFDFCGFPSILVTLTFQFQWISIEIVRFDHTSLLDFHGF